MNFFKSIFLILTFLGSSAVYSNDSTATVEAGGIQFKKSADISMDEEILKISINKVEVFYRFFNHADHQIAEVIAFPLPPVTAKLTTWPSWDEDYIVHKFLQENKSGSTNNQNLKSWLKNSSFIDFDLNVNGVGKNFYYQTIAIDPKGRNITDILNKHQIPLSPAFLQGYEEEGELQRNSALKNTLAKMDLLDSQGMPNWSLQTTYFWHQEFELKKELSISHRYTPGTGWLWLTARDSNKVPQSLQDLMLSDENFQKNGWSNYCVSKADEALILKRFQKMQSPSSSLRVQEIKYILTTGANWHGPIKKFRLEVTPPSHAITIACWPGKMEKMPNGNLATTINNFVPKKNLRILFISDSG